MVYLKCDMSSVFYGLPVAHWINDTNCDQTLQRITLLSVERCAVGATCCVKTLPWFKYVGESGRVHPESRCR